MEQRLDFIEFRQELLFRNSASDRIYFDYGITRQQHQQIVQLMEEYRDNIVDGEKVTHSGFEQKVYGILQKDYPDYHFVENLVKSYHEEGAWEEVFEALYGSMQKYSSYMNNKI